MLINVVGDATWVPVFDTLSSYYQSINSDYKQNPKIIVNADLSTADVNILNSNKIISGEDIEDYDLVFLNNGFESFSTNSHDFDKWIDHSKVFLVSGSRLVNKHYLNNKNIWYPAVMLIPGHRSVNTDFNFPTAFDLGRFSTCDNHKSGLVFQNGLNRSWRHHVIQCLKKIIPSIQIENNLSKKIIKTKDGMFESFHDRQFREQVNNIYDTLDHDPDYTYYDNSLDVGMGHLKRKVVPGWLLIDSYLRFKCVIFPETTWMNDDLQITEKIVKCFFNRNIPWPIGGRYINRQYNEIGFFTAWNLLPSEYQTFDLIEDHFERYQLLAIAVKWLYANQDVLYSQTAQKMLDQNFFEVTKFTSVLEPMVRINNIITKAYNDKSNI